MGMGFAPDERFASIEEISAQELASSGIAVVFSDLDNTLARWNDTHLPPQALAFAAKLRAQGIDLCLLSNNKAERVRPVAEVLRADFIAPARKPLPFRLRRYLRKRNLPASRCILLGDQLLTDILCGNLSGVRTALVKPIDLACEFAGTRFNRLLERPLYALLRIRWEEENGV